MKCIITAQIFDTIDTSKMLFVLMGAFESLTDTVENLVDRGLCVEEGLMLGLDTKEARLKIAIEEPHKYKQLIEHVVGDIPTDSHEDIVYEYFHHKERKYHDMAVRILKRWYAHGYTIDENKLLG